MKGKLHLGVFVFAGCDNALLVNVNRVQLALDILFPVISKKDQQTVVKKLDNLSFETKKLESIYQQKINDLEELKKSILQKAFSGELKSVKV